MRYSRAGYFTVYTIAGRHTIAGRLDARIAGRRAGGVGTVDRRRCHADKTVAAGWQVQGGAFQVILIVLVLVLVLLPSRLSENSRPD